MKNKCTFSLSSALFRQIILHIMFINYIFKSYVNDYHVKIVYCKCENWLL